MSGCGRASAKQPASKGQIEALLRVVDEPAQLGEVGVIHGEGFAPAQQFGVDLREFLDLLLELR